MIKNDRVIEYYLASQIMMVLFRLSESLDLGLSVVGVHISVMTPIISGLK